MKGFSLTVSNIIRIKHVAFKWKITKLLEGVNGLKKLLIVDDQAGIRMLLSEVFKNEGHITILASNGNEAIQKLKDEEPDCLLMDMRMPGMNGQEVLHHVKSNCPDFPVVLMTAYDKVETAVGDSDLRADHYFTKPFDIHELRRTVNQLLKDP